MNPNIAKEAHKGAAARTPEGKFRVSLNALKKRELRSNPQDYYNKIIPTKVKELFSWYKNLTLEERNFLFEMKVIYEVLKANLQNNEDITKKITDGTKLSMQEIAQFQLLINTLEKLQKLHYGEKKINIEISAKDLIGGLHDNR